MSSQRTILGPRRSDGGVLAVSPQIIVAGLLGGAAAAFGVALTTTSGWLIVRADQRPQILLLITAIVGVRTFGLGRPVFRYFERLRSHDAALEVLADRRAQTYVGSCPSPRPGSADGGAPICSPASSTTSPTSPRPPSG